MPGFCLQEISFLPRYPEYAVIGKPVPKMDAADKALGCSQYIADMSFPNMLYGKILRSPYPHARVLNVDLSRGLSPNSEDYELSSFLDMPRESISIPIDGFELLGPRCPGVGKGKLGGHSYVIFARRFFTCQSMR
jgi:hypothetical protein